MSVAYYVVLENGYQPEMGGKALAFEAKRLNAVSKTLGLKTLDDFVGTPSEELADLLGATLPSFDARWFSPDEGLILVEVYRQHISQEPESFRRPEALTEDLAQLKEILEIARASGTRWHFGLDF